MAVRERRGDDKCNRGQDATSGEHGLPLIRAISQDRGALAQAGMAAQWRC